MLKNKVILSYYVTVSCLFLANFVFIHNIYCSYLIIYLTISDHHIHSLYYQYLRA